MKIVLLGLYEDDEEMEIFYEFLNTIQQFTLPLEEGEERNNARFIYWNQYKFDRFDKEFVELVESKEYKSYFYTQELDDRFTDSKYYSIESDQYKHRDKHVFTEGLTIRYNDIVDDLYYKRFVYDA